MTVLEEDAVTEEANETPDEELESDDATEDDATADEGEGSEEPEALAPPGPAIGVLEEKAFERIEKSAATYTKAVGKATEGLDLGLQQCPCCQLPGLVFPYQGDTSDDVIRRTLVEEYFGVYKPQLQPDPAYVICDSCQGEGKRVTPSKVPGNREIMCTVCSGQGHREIAQIQAQATVASYANGTTSNPAWTPPPGAQLDEWGRPAGHPHFGMHPSTVGF